MRLSGFLVIVLIITFSTALLCEEIQLKLNQKEVDTGSKVEKFFSLFPDPPTDIKIQGPAKIRVLIRKIIDKKNPLTKLPVTVNVNLDTKKVKEVTLNDRDGTAVIKDATMFNAGSENNIYLDIPQGEHQIQITVTRSAIKGVLIRIEKIGEEKPVIGQVSQPPSEEKKGDKNFVPPIIPPLVPLVPPVEQKPIAEAKPTIPLTEAKKEEKKEEIKPSASAEKLTPQPLKTEHEIKRDEPVIKSTYKHPKKGFGDIVILSLKGGMILPFEYGNPGGYGEFSTSFNIFKGILLGASISSYNTNRDYIINDPKTGNSILKYHLHGVPISGFIGYKYQMQNILSKFELGSGVNMMDIDLRRKYTPEKTDTINSFQFNLSAELSYITRYGSFGSGIKYLYSTADNSGNMNGFAKDIITGGLIITIGYHYGF